MSTRITYLFALVFAVSSAGMFAEADAEPAEGGRPNILFVITDDQSFPYASAYGVSGVKTPGFDRVAREGVLFRQAFVPSPGCSPTRASILTGRYPWQNEHAGTHASSFSNQLLVYPQLLEDAGYWVGYTGKGWGPGNYADGGFQRNPAGPEFKKRMKNVPAGIRDTDYAGAFEEFLEQRPSNQPFCFWLGTSEPHRVFGKGLGVESGKQLNEADVPAFLPDTPEIREDILDYCFEIEWADQHLVRALKLLDERNELGRTLVVVTSDNGMAFPRAKANVYEYGIHVPLAICWGDRVAGSRSSDDLVNLVDLMPTFLEAAGVKHEGKLPMSGRSLMPILTASGSGHLDPQRKATYSGRERHSSSRWNNLAYPQRCIRTDDYLYICNFRPERWPAGTPRKMGTGKYPNDTSTLGPMHGGYHDIDACPSLTFMIQNAEDAELGHFLGWSVDRRPAEELYAIGEDPACLNNLADVAEHQDRKQKLAAALEEFLRETGDPRVLDGGDIFESYRRYSRIRTFPRPDWAKPETLSTP